jgi:hypothetical protein
MDALTLRENIYFFCGFVKQYSVLKSSCSGIFNSDIRVGHLREIVMIMPERDEEMLKINNFFQVLTNSVIFESNEFCNSLKTT